MRRLLPLVLVHVLLATPAYATQPSIFFVDDFHAAEDHFGDLQTTLPGTAQHPDLEEEIVDALHAVSEATYIELQYGFDAVPNTERPLWILTDPIWLEEEAPIGSGSVVYSRDLFLDAEEVIDDTVYARSLIPYLAALPHMELLVLHSTDEVAPLDPEVRRNLAEVLSGWWIGQQEGATLADCDAIADWRCEYSGESWTPAPWIRLGYGLREQSLAQVLAYCLPQAARMDEEVP